MSLRLKDKKLIVNEIAEQASSAVSAAVAEYSGLSANQMNNLRKVARESRIYIKVVHNNLAKRGVAGTSFECMKDIFCGPLIIAFSHKEPGSPAKLFRDFMKSDDKFKVKQLSINGEIFGIDKIEEISKLPTHQEAYALICSVLLQPIKKLTQTLNEIPLGTLRVLSVISERK